VDLLESYVNEYLGADVVAASPRLSIICLRGELDTLSSQTLLQAIDALPAEAATVAVDLADLDFIDAGGIWALVSASVQLRASHRELVVVCPKATATRLFDIAGADLTIDPTWDPE
jgi:anti-anti-sigma factor